MHHFFWTSKAQKQIRKVTQLEGKKYETESSQMEKTKKKKIII